MESPFPSRAELDPPEQTPHVCLLACSPHPDGSTDAAARLLEQALLSRGATVDRICLREYALHPCIGCGYCSAHPGHPRLFLWPPGVAQGLHRPGTDFLGTAPGRNAHAAPSRPCRPLRGAYAGRQAL